MYVRTFAKQPTVVADVKQVVTSIDDRLPEQITEPTVQLFETLPDTVETSEVSYVLSAAHALDTGINLEPSIEANVVNLETNRSTDVISVVDGLEPTTPFADVVSLEAGANLEPTTSATDVVSLEAGSNLEPIDVLNLDVGGNLEPTTSSTDVVSLEASSNLEPTTSAADVVSLEAGADLEPTTSCTDVLSVEASLSRSDDPMQVSTTALDTSNENSSGVEVPDMILVRKTVAATKVTDLKLICRKVGISSSGKRQDLENSLIQFYQKTPPTDPSNLFA